MNWIVRGSPEYNALMQQQQSEMTNSVNGLAQSYVPELSWSPSMNYGALGYQGEGFAFDPAAAVQGGTGYQITPELLAFLEQGGYQPGFAEGGQGAYSQAQYGIAGPDGQIVPGTQQTVGADTGSDLRDWMLYSAALYGAGTGLQGGIDGLAAGGGTQGAAGADMGSMMAGSADGGALAASGSGVGGGTAAPTITTTMGGSAGAAPATASGFGGLTSGQWAQLAQTGIGLYGQNRATDAMQEGAQQQNALLREMWQANRADNQPLVDMRNSVLPQLQGLINNPSSITQDPGYQFGLNQGQNQINNNAAARGGYYSGQQLKASQRYGQDYAGTKLDQSVNRLMGVAGLGQLGSNANQQANTNYGTQAGNNLMQQGNIRGSGYMGAANIAGSGIGQWQNTQDNDYWMRQIFGGPR